MMSHRNLIVAASLLTFAVAIHAQSGQSLPAHFTAFAVSTGDAVSRPVADTVQMDIKRWASEAESQRLMSVLKEKGAEKMLDGLRDAKPVDTIRTPGTLACYLHDAHS